MKKMTRRGAMLGAGLVLLSGCAQPTAPVLRDDRRFRSSVVNTTANVRTGPGTRFPVVTSLGAGTGVRIYGSRGGWLRIETAEVRGWIHESLIGERRRARRRRPRRTARRDSTAPDSAPDIDTAVTPAAPPPATATPEGPVVTVRPCEAAGNCAPVTGGAVVLPE